MLPHHPFYFLRHGETDYNLAGKMMGVRDIPLNATGRAQAEQARAAVHAVGFKSIAASPLARAWETASIVNDGMSLAMTPVQDLREVDVGVFEGASDPSFMRRWHGGEPMERCETFADFTIRIGRGLVSALELDHPVLVVAHGGVFRAIEKLLGFAGTTDVPNCCLARFEPPASLDGAWRIAVVSTLCDARM
jgi:probable phosphoglycerate mutase